MLEIRMPIPEDINEGLFFDPTSLRYLHTYNIVENLYSTLVEYSEDGQLVSGLAKRYYWQGSSIVFELRKLPLSNGHMLTAREVVNSIKRAILRSTAHGDLENVLCIEKLSSLNDECSNLVSESDRVILKLKDKNPSILEILSYHDFAILPEDSYDKETLNIVNQKTTTGTYFVHEKKDGHLELRPNEWHWHYNKRMPQVVKVISFPIDSTN